MGDILALSSCVVVAVADTADGNEKYLVEEWADCSLAMNVPSIVHK